MRIRKGAVFFSAAAIVILLLTGPCCLAEAFDELSDAAEIEDLEDALPEAGRDAFGDLRVEEALNADGIFAGLGAYLRENAGNALADTFSAAARVFFAVLLCAAVSALFGESRYITLAGVLAVSAVCFADAGAVIAAGSETLSELSLFSKALLPTLSSAAAMSGAVTSSAAKFAASVLFMDLLISAAEKLVVPLVYAYLASSIGCAAFGGEGLKASASFLKWLAGAVLTVITLLFTAYLSVTGLISGSADAAAARAAKTAVSTVLPVVGGIISDAAGTVLSGAAILRNAVGIFGLAAVGAVCLLPVLRIGIRLLIFRAAAALSRTVSDGKLSELIGNVSSAFGIILGAVGAAAVMLFISIISFVKAVV